MSVVDERFSELRARSKKAFIPFVTAGDPHLAFTGKLLRELSDRGADVIEVGFPYSDPIADGPVIQASYTRALDQKISTGQIFEAVGGVAGELSAPLVAMVSYAIVLRHGIDNFTRAAKQAGFSGFIIPDLLFEESAEMQATCRREDISLIQLVTPTTPRERAVKIAQASSGFLYYVSIAGITGERRDLPDELVDNVAWLRGQTELPICIGFGISQPEHVATLAPVADGVIVGSAIVKRIDPSAEEDQLLESIGSLVEQLISALPKVPSS